MIAFLNLLSSVANNQAACCQLTQAGAEVYVTDGLNTEVKSVFGTMGVEIHDNKGHGLHALTHEHMKKVGDWTKAIKNLKHDDEPNTRSKNTKKTLRA